MVVKFGEEPGGGGTRPVGCGVLRLRVLLKHIFIGLGNIYRLKRYLSDRVRM